jgi:hypothetical protein
MQPCARNFDWAAMADILFLFTFHWSINVFKCEINHVLHVSGRKIPLRAALVNVAFSTHVAAAGSHYQISTPLRLSASPCLYAPVHQHRVVIHEKHT